MSRHPEAFKVIIVGGGVAGLTLSLTLAAAGIDYILLEAHQEFVPHSGASIAVFPNGAKTLDQLGSGVLDDLYRVSSPLAEGYARDDTGKPMYYINMSRCQDRYGYPAGFLPRQKLLELLYRHVPDKSKLLPGKRVSGIVHSETGVRVITQDGEEYQGDIVIGADGTHSVVRREIWDLADKLKPGLITEEERNTLSAEYCAVVGISAPVPGVPPDSSNMNHNSGHSSIIISGMGGQIFWFLFEKMDKTYKAPDIPRFTKEDGRKIAEKRLKSHVTESVLFEEVWNGTSTFLMVPMEEGLFRHQHFGRMAIIGDAAHKVTINLGLGANATIESATALTNALHKALKAHPEGLDFRTIDELFTQMQAEREISAKSLDIAASATTRTHAWATPALKFMSRYLVKYFKGEDFVWDGQNDIQRRVARLDFLPDPDKGAIPTVYSPRNPGERSRVASLAVYFLPVLALVGYQLCISNWIGDEAAQIIGHAAREEGVLNLGRYSRFLGFGLSKVFVCNFSRLPLLLDHKLDAGQRLFTSQVVLGLFPILTIWIVEGLRRGNSMTLSKIPTFWGLLCQILPTSFIIPLYFYAHARQITPTRYYERNFFSIPLGYAKTLIPTLAISFLIPTALLLGREKSYKESLALWLPYPIYASLVHQLLRFLVPTPTKAQKNADLPYLRCAYLLSFLVSALAHMSILDSAGYPSFFQKQPPRAGFAAVWFDHLVAAAAGFMWVMVLFDDVMRFRKTNAGWLTIIPAISLGTVAVGPAATIMAAYAFREEALRA